MLQLFNTSECLIDEESMMSLISAVKTRSPQAIISEIFCISALQKQCELQLIMQLDKDCTDLCLRSKPSILRKNKFPGMSTFDWKLIIEEIKSRCPILLKVFVTVMGKMSTEKLDQFIAPLCTCYAIMMQKRNHELSLVQRVNTVLLAEGNASKKV